MGIILHTQPIAKECNAVTTSFPFTQIFILTSVKIKEKQKEHLKKC